MSETNNTSGGVAGSSLLILTESQTFMVNSLVTRLKKADIMVSVAGILSGVPAKPFSPDYVLLQAEEFSESMIPKFEQICVDCADNGVGLILMGYDGTIDQLKHAVSSYTVTAELRRPLDVGAACDKLQEIIAVHKSKENNETSIDRKKIMAVDDSGAMLRTILAWLEDEYEVTLVNSATKALILLHTKRPDLILLDYEMPVLSGAELYHKLLADPNTANIPVVFLTSKDDALTVSQVLSLKPAGYVLKTTTGEKLKRKIKEVLG